MIEKTIVFQSKHEECSMEKISPDADPGQLEKVASGRLSDELKDYIEENIEKDPNYVYVLVSALGAGEVWGPNINGDYFEEDEIKDSYKTFEEIGHVFTHHQNKDPKKAKGEIVFSHWNPRMHRVELIVRINRTKAPGIANDIDNGKMWDVSMGCKVPYDVCSICKKKAKTTDDYCRHLEEHKGEVLPDGRQVYMINKNPRFFDISFVYIGADRTAKSLMKVASQLDVPVQDLVKKSDIEKEIPGDIISKDAGHMAALLMQEFDKIKPYEKDFPKDTLNNLADFPIRDLLKTLTTLGIVLKPHEFQRVFLIHCGENPERFDDVVFDHRGELPNVESVKGFKPLAGNLDVNIAKSIIPRLRERSSLKPYIYPRLIKMASDDRELEKPKKRRRISSDDLAVPGLIAGAALYRQYLKNVPQANAKGLDKTVKEKPWMLPLMTGGAISGVKGVSALRKSSNQPLEKRAGNLGGRVFAGVPAAHLTSHIAGKMDSESDIIKFIENHPNLTALLGVSATNTVDDWKRIKQTYGDLKEKVGSMMNKTAAQAVSMNDRPSELAKDVSMLYNRYKDNMNSHINKVAQVLYETKPLDEGADILASGAIKKISEKI